MTADAVGGVWTYCLQLAAGFAEEGIEVILANMGPLPSTQQLADAALLDNVHLVTNAFALEWMDEPWRQVDEAGDWLLRLENQYQPDLIHLNGFVHASLPWQAPVVVVAHSCVWSWWRAVKGGNAPKKYAEYRRRVTRGLQLADMVVAPTEAMMNALTHEYGSLPNERVIYNGRSSHRLHTTSKEALIFSAGRIADEAKNLLLLNEIAPSLRWPVAVAGNAPSPKVGANAFKHLYLAGQLSEKGMASYLGRASIYAAPALYEPFGLAILEAAMSGCALVLSDIPSLRELWEGAAVFVPADSPAAWEVALNSLIKDQPRREGMGLLAFRRAQKFSAEDMVQGYLAAYEELLAVPQLQESVLL
jgi:glycosyltransferase involved in cell wall biosynthesis